MRSQRQHAPAAAQAGPGELETTTSSAVLAEERALTTRQIAWRRFRRHKLAIASGITLIFMSLAVVFAPLFTGYNFHEQSLTEVMQGPSAKHWLGTDNLGRDVLTRLLYGGRISLLVGVASVLASTVIGTLLGLVAGYVGRWRPR